MMCGRSAWMDERSVTCIEQAEWETSSLQAHVSLQLAKDVQPLELVQKLDDDLLCSMSLNYLAKVNITAVDQINNKTWCPAQVSSVTGASRFGF